MAATLDNVLKEMVEGLSEILIAIEKMSEDVTYTIEVWSSALVNTIDDASDRLAAMRQQREPSGDRERGKSRIAAGGYGLADFAKTISSATSAIIGPFQQLAAAVVPFVQALNPNLIFGLNYAFRSLMATIGIALTPVVEVLTGAIRQVAGILLPVMQQLAPVFRTITQTLISLLLPQLLLIADILEALSPVFELVSSVAKELASGFKALTAIGRTVVQMFLEFIGSLFGGGDVKDFLRKFRDAVHMVIGALLKLTAYLAKAFGQLGFIDKLTANLRDLAKPKPGAAPAPQDVAVRELPDIARTMAIAAFAAQGGAGEDMDEKKWLAKIAGEIEGIAKNGETLGTVLDKSLSNFWKTIKNWLTGFWPFNNGGNGNPLPAPDPHRGIDRRALNPNPIA